jgi:hypothetical protein
VQKQRAGAGRNDRASGARAIQVVPGFPHFRGSCGCGRASQRGGGAVTFFVLGCCFPMLVDGSRSENISGTVARARARASRCRAIRLAATPHRTN